MTNPAVEGMKEALLEDMISARKGKFKAFLSLWRLVARTTLSEDQHNLLESFYTWMRILDDVADGDREVPLRYDSASDLIFKQYTYVFDPHIPQDDIEFLADYTSQLAKKLDIDIMPESKSILQSLLWDAERLGTGISFDQKTLDYHFFDLDILGCIRGALKLIGSDPNRYAALKDLGVATRIYYNLRDYDEDVAKGFVNMSEEDQRTFNVSPSEILESESVGVKRWVHHQSKKGLELISESGPAIKEAPTTFERMMLTYFYAKPAERYFKKVLNV